MTSTQTKLLPPPHLLAANQTQATVREANRTPRRKGMERAGTAGHKPGTLVPKRIQTSHPTAPHPHLRSRPKTEGRLPHGKEASLGANEAAGLQEH